MTDHDHVVALVNRALGAHARGEELGEAFELEFAGLTDEEREYFFTLLDQKAAHGEEREEVLAEDVRILDVLLPFRDGRIGAEEAVNRIRDAVPDLD